MKSKDSKIIDPKDINIHIISERSTLKEIITLLAYIRSAINSGRKHNIMINIGHNKKTKFSFSVNDEEIPNYVVKDELTIN